MYKLLNMRKMYKHAHTQAYRQTSCCFILDFYCINFCMFITYSNLLQN